jgi:hypothetical protein
MRAIKRASSRIRREIEVELLELDEEAAHEKEMIERLMAEAEALAALGRIAFVSLMRPANLSQSRPLTENYVN